MSSRRRAIRRTAGHAWPLVQATVAATAAWVIARQLIHDHLPYFAPIAAVITLNASRGERGLNALRLVLGVFVGIGAGELSVVLLGDEYPALVAATLIALLAARALGTATLVLNQAAVAAILTVIAADGQAGLVRLIDALIGTAVALVFTQVLFSPEPVRMLRRAQIPALVGIGDLLNATAGLCDQDKEDGSELLSGAVPGAVVQLVKTRKMSARSGRRSALWRWRQSDVERELTRAVRVDLLGASSLMLCRIALALDPPRPNSFAVLLRRLGCTVSELSDEPEDFETRQRAADEALAALREFADASDGRERSHTVAVNAVRIFVADFLGVVGVDADDAAEATRSADGSVVVPPLPSAPRFPFTSNRSDRS